MIRNILMSASQYIKQAYLTLDIFGDSSCKALYALENNALDESGNYNGTPTSMTYGTGISGKCGVFNGTSSYIDTTYSPASASAITISFWINTAITYPNPIMGTTGASSYNGILLYINSTTKTLHAECNDSTAISLWSINSVSSISVSSFVHCVISWDGTTSSNGVKLYVNNVLESQGTAVKTAFANGTTLKLGKQGTAAGYFNGSLDQIRVFNKALTQTEVTQLYTNLA
jgi:hypothetical protein